MGRVDQLLGGGRDLGEDPEPGERVIELVEAQHPFGDRRAADAVEAVAAGDRVAAELLLHPLVCETDTRLVRVDVVQRDVVDLEEQRAAGVQPGRDQVLDHLLLAVDRDRPPLGELLEGDPVALAVEAELDALVDETLAVKPVGEAKLGEQIDCALLEDARPDPLLHVFPTAVLEHHALDPLSPEEMREDQAGRTGAHDADLGARAHLTFHALSSLRRRRLPTLDDGSTGPRASRSTGAAAARSNRRVSAMVTAAARASPAHSDQAAVKWSCSASRPTSRGPPAAPAKRPDIITPTAQAGASGRRKTTASVSVPGHDQPMLPTTRAASTITAGSPAISSR